MRIGIVGAGALGLYYGAMLQKSGQEVHFLARRDYQALIEQGLQVSSVNGDFHLPKVNAHLEPEQIGPVDLVIVGLKTFANDQLLALVRPLVAPQTVILTLQNGLGNEDLLATAFPAEQILGGVAFLCSNRGAPGNVQHLGEGKIRLGEYRHGRSARSQQLAELFTKAGIPCEAVSDLQRARWEKLIWNIPFNGLCALLDKDVTALLAHPPCRQLIVEIMREVVAATNAEPAAEPFDGEPFIARMLELTAQMDHYCPSMLIDRRKARPLELEAIYAKPLQRALATGVEMPRTQMLYQLLSLGEVGVST